MSKKVIKAEEMEVKKELIPFERALKMYKTGNEMAKVLMADKEAMTIYMKKFIPSLMATKEEFFDLLKKF